MKSLSTILVGLFAAQLAVAGVLYFNTWNQRSVRPQGSLLTLDASEVDQLLIEGEGESVTLDKKQDTWLIGSTGLPADTSRVDSAIQSFSDMQLGWSVASSDASHQQLEVADDNYQRRVKISSGGDTVGDIFIGTSPGFKRSHVRKEGADEVYSVAINTFDLPPESSDWLDKTLLQVADVSSVRVNDKELLKKDEQWVYDGSDNTDQDKASGLVTAFESLRVTEIFDQGADELDFEKVVLKTGDDEYEFGFASLDNNYLVSRQDIDSIFKISKSSYDKVVAVDLLLPEPEPEPEPASDAEPPSDPASATTAPEADDNDEKPQQSPTATEGGVETGTVSTDEATK